MPLSVRGSTRFDLPGLTSKRSGTNRPWGSYARPGNARRHTSSASGTHGALRRDTHGRERHGKKERRDRGRGRQVPAGDAAQLLAKKARPEHVAHASAPCVRREAREALHFRFGEQPVQQLLPLPFVAAEPADEPLLALVLEADHEEPVRTVDGRRHDLELRDLCGVPHASVPITIFDGSLESRAREWARHMTDGEEQIGTGDKDFSRDLSVRCVQFFDQALPDVLLEATRCPT